MYDQESGIPQPTTDIPERQSAVLQCLCDLEHNLGTEAIPGDVRSALPPCAHPGPLSVVPSSKGSSIESESGEKGQDRHGEH